MSAIEPTPERDPDFPGEVEMSFADHLEELRWRLLRSLASVVIAAAGCLILVRPLVRLLEQPAEGMRFMQLAPGEFLFVSIKVAGYAGLTLALPYVLFEGLGFVLPGLSRRERRLIAPAVAGSAVLFLLGLAFAWWAWCQRLGADGLRRRCGGADLVDRALPRFRAAADAGHGPSFQLPILQLVLGSLGILNSKAMLSGWRLVVLLSAWRVPCSPLHRSGHDAVAQWSDHRALFGGCGPGGLHRSAQKASVGSC